MPAGLHLTWQLVHMEEQHLGLYVSWCKQVKCRCNLQPAVSHLNLLREGAGQAAAGCAVEHGPCCALEAALYPLSSGCIQQGGACKVVTIAWPS